MRSSVRIAILLMGLATASSSLPLPGAASVAAPQAPDRAAPPPEISEAQGPVATAGSGTDAAGYDAVGYANWYGQELSGNRTATGEPFNPDGITAAHRTLPLGSYAEITSLSSGRTIIVRINDRGPVQRNLEIDLSRGAATLLGIGRESGVPVRVRGITPSPQDMTALRAGKPASERLDAPPVLLAALRKNLPGRRGSALVVAATQPAEKAVVVRPAQPAPPPEPRVERGGYVVQIATFSSEARARTLARQLDGMVQSMGDLYRVRLGPFMDMKSAQRARDGAARRGYGGGQILANP